MQDREFQSDDSLAALSAADDDAGGVGFEAAPAVLELDAGFSARRRELWNYTAMVHFGGGTLAARPARGMVVAANVAEARDRARAAAERMFRVYGRAMAVIVTRLW